MAHSTRLHWTSRFRASKGSRVARLLNVSTPSSQYTGLEVMECQTLQMTLTEFGLSRLNCTDLKTLCTAHSTQEKDLMILNRITNTLKSKGGAHQTFRIRIKKELWKWLAKIHCHSQRDRDSTRMLRKPSKKWRTIKAKPSWPVIKLEISTRYPKWARNLLPRVNFPNSLLKVRKKLVKLQLIDYRKCQRDLNSRIN